MRAVALVGGLAGVLFALAAAPGLTWLDAGELGAAAWELGVAHPPGLPVFALLHKLLMLLVPVGDVAFRGNLASGLLGAAAVAATTAAATRLGARPAAAVAGASLAATAGLFLPHALTIEVYSGAALFTALFVWGFAAWRATGDRRALLALGLLAGLAAGHHAELRLFALVVALGCLPKSAGARRSAVAFALIGALVVLYLPLRSLADPWRDWGDPETPAALWAHWMGARIRLAFAGQFGAPTLEALATFARQWADGAPVLLVLGLAGAVVASRRPGGWLVAGLWAVDVAYATVLNPMGLRDAQNGGPGVVAAAIGAALLFDALLERARAARVLPVAAAAISALFVLPRTGDRGAPALVRAALDEAPPAAALFVASDGMAAGLAFVQVVEGARPDAAVVVRQHVWDASSIEPVRRRLPAALAGWRPGANLHDLEVLRRGPLRWEWASDTDVGARPPELGPAFPLFAPGAADDGTFERRMTGLLDELGPGGLDAPDARRAFGHVLQDLGRWRLRAGDAARAVTAFEAAAALDAEAVTAWNNLGSARSALGDFAGAIAATERAVALAPGDRTAHVNLARYRLQRDEDAAAAGHVDALLARDAGDADAIALRGILRARRGDLAGAAADFDAALALDPAQPEARAGRDRLRKP